VDSVWEAIFMLLVLKIPLVYLAVVVWWAIRAEPVPGGESGREDGPVPLDPLPLAPCGWDDWKRRRSTRSRMRPGKRPIRPAPLVARS
jgi:hypothetical protein